MVQESSVRDVAGDALENLVSQFSSKYDCIRELVQNSIDAGSQRIDVWTEFSADGSGGGTIILHVDDDGEGMDRAIIEGQLTKLFSSRKEGDLTKIGKFGIGFVSIFALEPAAVLLHTGRGGEYWEVLFHQDRSFQLKELDEPSEGTQLSLFMKGPEASYREFASEIYRALFHWCCHSETEITFEDRAGAGSKLKAINVPFRVPGEISAHHEVTGTEIVAAYNRQPVYGFYNRGLALYLGQDGLGVLEDRSERFRHIGFKVKSRYLEHTLSRDTVVKDENYEKAMGFLEELVDGPLLDTLLSALEELARRERSAEEQKQLEDYCFFLSQEPPANLKKAISRRILSVHHQSPLSAVEALENLDQEGKSSVALYASGKANPVTHVVNAWSTVFAAVPQLDNLMNQSQSASAPDGRALVLLRLLALAQDEQGGFLKMLRGGRRREVRLLDPAASFFVVETLDGNPVQHAVLDAAQQLLVRLGFTGADLSWVRLAADSPQESPPFLLQFRSQGCAEPLPKNESVDTKRLAVVVTHGLSAKIIALGATLPRQAGFMLAQRVLLSNLVDEPCALALVEVFEPDQCDE